MNKLMIALAALGFAGSAAIAQDAAPTDADGSGNYSFEELLAAYPNLTPEAFTSIDANADGAVDADELAAAQSAGTLAN